MVKLDLCLFIIIIIIIFRVIIYLVPMLFFSDTFLTVFPLLDNWSLRFKKSINIVPPLVYR